MRQIILKYWLKAFTRLFLSIIILAMLSLCLDFSLVNLRISSVINIIDGILIRNWSLGLRSLRTDSNFLSKYLSFLYVFRDLFFKWPWIWSITKTIIKMISLLKITFWSLSHLSFSLNMFFHLKCYFLIITTLKLLLFVDSCWYVHIIWSWLN